MSSLLPNELVEDRLGRLVWRLSKKEHAGEDFEDLGSKHTEQQIGGVPEGNKCISTVSHGCVHYFSCTICCLHHRPPLWYMPLHRSHKAFLACMYRTSIGRPMPSWPFAPVHMARHFNVVHPISGTVGNGVGTPLSLYTDVLFPI